MESSSCIGCPTGASHAGSVVLALLVIAAGVLAWAPLGRADRALGRLVAGFAVLCGLGLLVVGA